MANKNINQKGTGSSNEGKRKFEETVEDDSSSDDEDKLFIPEAREVLGQSRPRKPLVIREIPEITEDLCSSNDFICFKYIHPN